MPNPFFFFFKKKKRQKRARARPSPVRCRMFCVYFSFPTNPIPPVASEPPSPTRPADLGKRTDGPELGRQNKRGGLYSSCPVLVSSATPRPRPLALHTRSSPAAATEEERREGGPSVLSRRTLLPSCGATPQTNPPKAVVWVRHQISRNSGCVGALSGFDQAFRRRCCCRSLARGFCRASQLYLLCSSFPLHQHQLIMHHPPPPPPPPAPGSRPAEPGPSPRNGNSWFPWPPHRIASSSHTGTGTRAQAHDDGRIGETVCLSRLPVPFGYFPIPSLECEFDGWCPAVVVKPRIGIDVCSHSAASTGDRFDTGAFSGTLAVEIQYSTATYPRVAGEERRELVVSPPGGDWTLLQYRPIFSSSATGEQRRYDVA